MFKIDEYAKVIESGEVGEIMDVRGDHVTLFLRSMADCQPEGTVFDMCELVPATIPKVKSSQLGPFVRGEISIEEITAGTGFVLSELVMDSEPYRITAADFLAGVRVYAKKPAKTVCIWLEILLRDLEDYILPHETDRIIRDEVTEKDIINRAVDLAFGLLWLLDWQYQCEISEKEWEPLEELLSKWVESDGKEYSDYFRHKIVNQFDEDSIDSESEKTQRLFKECLDYLCDEKKDKEAIRKRGYCYYCGTKVYPNDWVKARDSFIDYYNMTGDASAANTLGYIYYYGRCNGGIPQYEEAFKYFSIGHAYSYFESTYKLADMLSHGYGVVKDVDSANHLYWSVYNENVKRFRKGEVTGKFADAALRIGNCFRDEIGERKSARIAYHYYLQADLAIRARIKAANCYGDNSVFTGIQNAMKEVRTEYTEYRRTRKFWGTEWTNWVLLGHRRCKATVKELKNGVLSLRFSPMKRYDENEAPMMLITVEEADYCELKKKINIKTAPGSRFISESGNKEFVFDHIYYDANNNRTRFFLFEEPVFEIYTEYYTFTAPSKKTVKKTGKVYHFASVKFSENGRVFDYICDDMTVKEGDTVIVNGYNGETPVTVVEVSDRYESELGLPVERYKKILRKLRRG